MASNNQNASDRDRLAAILRENDEEAFRDLVQEHLPLMLRVARHELDYYVFEGYIGRQDLAPEDVVGDALIRAWTHLKQRPEEMSLRGWLLGISYRTVKRMAEKQRQYRNETAVSLDAPLPVDSESSDVQESFWEWYQPDENLTWEDVVPAVEPVDLEIPLYDVRDTLALDPDLRHVLMMHDEFAVPINEVAIAMNRAVVETAELVDQARASLRERLAASEPNGPITHPSPPAGSDQ